MATYIPNATQTTEPVESRTVESAALEFRTLKAQNNSQDVRLTAVENALLFIGEGIQPGTVYVQRLSGTGAQTVFTLNTVPHSVNVVDIYINGIYQNKDTFTVAGADVIFSDAPPAGTNNIEVQVTVTIALGETDASLVTYGGTTVAAQLDAFAQLQNIPTGTILGRASADTGDVEALTGAQATALLSAASETVSGLVELADAAEAQALASAVVALTPARLADAFKGANQSLNTSGYQKLPGGLIIQWGRLVLGTISSDYHGTITFPIAFPSQILQVNVSLYSYAGDWFDSSAAVTGQSLTGFGFTAQEWSNAPQNLEIVYIAIGN